MKNKEEGRFSMLFFFSFVENSISLYLLFSITEKKYKYKERNKKNRKREREEREEKSKKI